MLLRGQTKNCFGDFFFLPLLQERNITSKEEEKNTLWINILQQKNIELNAVVCTCYTSDLGGWDRRNAWVQGSSPARTAKPEPVSNPPPPKQKKHSWVPLSLPRDTYPFTLAYFVLDIGFMICCTKYFISNHLHTILPSNFKVCHFQTQCYYICKFSETLDSLDYKVIFSL